MFAGMLASFLGLAIGVALVALCSQGKDLTGSNLLMKLCLALGIGYGASSIIFFLCLVEGHLVAHIVFIDAASLVFLLSILWMSIAHSKSSSLEISAIVSKTTLDRKIVWLCLVGFVLAFGSSLWSFTALALRAPHGEWDALFIWNLRARFLFLAGSQWQDAFSELIPWSHTDYPLLLPISVARIWKYIGHDTVIAPVVVALVFTYATVGLTISTVAVLRNWSQGLLAGIVLVSTPFFVEHGASQYADVPLSFFFLATIALLCLQDRNPQMHLRPLILAGMVAGFGAWTKNEGLMFFACVVTSISMVIAYLRGWRECLNRLIPFFAGSAPILIIIIFFKMHFHGRSDIFTSPHLMAHSLIDFQRDFQIVAAFEKEVFDFGAWAFAPAPILFFYLLLLGTDVDAGNSPHLIAAALALFMALIGYAVIYAIGPQDIQWWLRTSLNRLLLQLWPSAVLMFFLIVRTPEQAMDVGFSKV